MSEAISNTDSAREWLAAWDTDKTVWSIEMGGIGPGYEMAIQQQAAENLRWLLEKGFAEDAFGPDQWPSTKAQIDKAPVHVPGLSGAQWGASWNLALCLYRRGQSALDEEKVKDRRILVSRLDCRGVA